MHTTNKIASVLLQDHHDEDPAQVCVLVRAQPCVARAQGG